MFCSDRSLYEHFVAANAQQATIFHQSWWLDAVCGSQSWKPIMLCNQAGGVCMATAFQQKKFRLAMPPLTPYLDPVGAPNYLDNWLDLLPLGLGCGVYIRLKTLNLVPNSKGLDLKPARRYWLPLQADLPNFGLKLSDLCRREIKRGAETLRIEISLEADVLHQMFKNALERKGLQLAVDPSVLQRLVGACSTHGQGAVYVAKDTTGNAVAAALVVWDHQNAYYLGGGGKGGVMRSLLWRAISDAAKKGLNFDFGGGEVAGVAQFYASFGAQLAVGSRLTYYKGPFSRFAIKLWKNARHSADRPFH